MSEDIELREETAREGDTVVRPRGELPRDPLPVRPEGGLRLPVKVAITFALVALAIVSAIFVANWASKPETHATSIASLDGKAKTVTGLAAASTAAAGMLSLLPGDAGTPIAEKLVDLGSDFLVVMAAIYLEKYLLTIFGLAAFRILIPIACACFVGVLWLPWNWKEAASRLGARMLLFGIAVAIVVPASIGVSDMIERTYSADIAHAEAIANELGETDLAELEALEETAAEDDPAGSEQGSTSLLGTLVGWATGAGEAVVDTVTGAVDSVSGAAAGFVETARETLNEMIEALAVLIVTNCVIPIVVLLFFVWLVNTILGTNLYVPLRGPRPMHGGHHIAATRIQ